MNRPIVAAIALFLGMCLGELGGVYFSGREPAWGFTIAAAVGSGLVAYALADWKQKKTD